MGRGLPERPFRRDLGRVIFRAVSRLAAWLTKEEIRRIVLKTTQRILVGWIAVAMSISAGFGSTPALPEGMAVALLGGAVFGATGRLGFDLLGLQRRPVGAAHGSLRSAGSKCNPGPGTRMPAA